uniref:hypothetical protein n=1 Tax=Sphingomonas sp. TaxID=28214 RepID=UPI0025D09CB3|nr:hypothetical protein [Sphingomonas sp.]
MSENPTEQQQYELDRALLDEHGPSYIETICSFADGMRAEGRTADADDAMGQCARMRAMRLSDKDLLAAVQRTDGESAEAGKLSAEIERRRLDF